MFKKPQFHLNREEQYNTLIFVSLNQIFALNYEKESLQVIYEFATRLVSQPNYFISNMKQDVFLVASEHDGFWVNLNERIDVDLNDLYNISHIVCLLYDYEEECFYIFSNKEGESMGIFICKFYVN